MRPFRDRVAALLLLMFLFAPAAAQAQSAGTVVADCGVGVSNPYVLGSNSPFTLLNNGAACITGTISTSTSGFTATSTGTPFTATTGGATGTLPTGAVVVATNVGASVGAYCALGGAATTASQYIPPGAWFAYTVGASTQLTCITAASTTTINMTGGTGLPSGTSGGGGASANASVAPTAGAVPGSATYVGINTAGNLVGWTGAVTQGGTWNIGSITNTLPSFSTTQTFNLGTLNGAATAANQTDGSQKTQIVDTGGNVVGVTTNALDVNCIAGCSGGGGGGGTSSNFGTAFPNAGTAIGFSDGTNMVSGLVDGSGNIKIVCSNCSGSGASAVDEANFTAGTDVFAPAGGFFQTTATSNALTNGQQGMWQMTANRAGFVNLRTAAGVETGVAAAPLQVSLANTAANATAVKVDGSAVTQPVSGTVAATQSGGWAVTANAGTNLNTSALALEGGGNLASIKTNTDNLNLAQGSTTSGQKGGLFLGAVTTAAPSYTTAQSSPLSLTTAGLLRVDGTGGTFPLSGSVAATQSGTWTVQPGNTANTTAWLVTGTGGTFPATQSGTWNITNISGTVSLPTGAATAALQPSNSAIGATTSGQTGNLMMGATTTAAPSYTTAQTNPLSLTTAGLLRVDGTGGTFPISGSLTANQSVNVAQINGMTPLMGNGVTGTGSPRVTIASDGTAISTAGYMSVKIDQTTSGTTNFVTVASNTAPVSTMNSASANAGTTAALAGVFDDTSPTSITENNFGFVRMSSRREIYDQIRDAAGNERGANVNAENGLTVSTVASATNGATTAGAIQPNNTTAVVVKASAGTLLGVQAYNIGSGPAYLKIYNATSATCGSGTPVKRLLIPKAGTAADGAGNNIPFGPVGVAFGTGITYCVTTGIGDSDTTAAAANTVLINVDYK